MTVDSLTAPQTRTVLARELADFLIELSIALNKRAMYPGDHPSLAADQERLMRRLDALLRERQSLAVGVAHDQLIIEGVATDPRNPLLHGLAMHLHRHRIGAAKFLAGTRSDEMRDVLRTLAADAERDGAVFALDGTTGAPRWEHIRLFPLSYDQLELVDADEDVPHGTEREPWSAQLWLDLARAALQAESPDTRPPTDPAVVARAINTHAREQAYDQVIVGYLLKIAGELKTGSPEESATLQRRVSGLVRALDPAQLRTLLTMSGDGLQRRRFVLDASHSMAVDAVLTLVHAAADVSQHTISTPLLRMFRKLAAHAERGTEQARPAAEAALREHVRALVADWQLDDPNPGLYSAVLDRAARDASRAVPAGVHTHPCEPERLVQMSLEMDSAGRQVLDAVDTMVADGRIGMVVDLVKRAPDTSHAGGIILQQLSTPERLRLVLTAVPPNLEQAEVLAQRMGTDAADPLLDVLEHADSRAVRRKIIELLAHLGADIGPALVARLPTAPWFFQRNLLMVLARLAAWPAGFSLDPYVVHADVRVRREAIRAQLKMANARDHAICTALTDDDEHIVRLALTAALDGCPPAALPLIAERLGRREVADDLELLAIRVVALSNSPTSRECLLRYAMPARGWLGGRRLAPKSPPVLAALAALATRWSHDPQVLVALERAARHADPEMRAAVASWRQAG